MLIDSRIARLLENTLWLAGGACLIALPIGALLALVLARTDVPCRRLFSIVLAGWLFLPLIVQAGAWEAGFGIQGWTVLGGGAQPWLGGWPAAVWVHAMAGVPWVVLIVALGLRTIEPEWEEEALLSGGAWQAFWHVTLRQTWAVIGVAALWVAMTAVGEMTVTDLYKVRTYAEELYTEAALGAEAEQAPLGTLPILIVVAALAVSALAVIASRVPRLVRSTHRPAMVYQLGGWRWPLAGIVGLAMLVIVGIPLVSLAWKAGIEVANFDGLHERHWSPVKCLAQIAESPWRYRREIGWSLVIGSTAAAIAVAAATPLAWWARRGATRVMTLLAVAALVLALPGPVIGLGLIELLNRPEIDFLARLYDYSILAPCLAQAIRAFPWAVFVLWPALASVPQETIDAARCDGAGPATMLLHIVLPLRRSSLAVAWLVALAVAWGDVAASILVIPPGVQTLTWRLFDLLHYGAEDRVAAICLAQAGISVAIVWVVTLLGRRSAVR
jgi:iron(III) transport system permease protein